MSISFECHRCGKSYSVSDELAGKAARCKQCGQRLTIPAREDGPSAADIYDLDEPPPSPRAAADESGVLPPRFGAAPVRAPMGDGSDGDASGSGPAMRKLGGAAVIVLVVALRIGGAYLKMKNREARRNAAREASAPAAPGGAPAVARPLVMPAFPDPGPGLTVESGVRFHSVAMGPAPPGPDVLPGHGMRLWLYLPPGDHAPGSLPCVMIAPAGSNLIVGNELDQGKGDHPEHLPYAQSGFAVLAYGLDGEWRDKDNASLRRASETFLAARAGLWNARVAMEWLLAKVPAVDPSRIYAAGHSSAGTMALLLAENEPRIKACVAFAPRSDISKKYNPELTGQLRRLLPWLDEFRTTYNPKAQEARLNCPLFLFHARDDSVVPIQESQAFANDLRNMGKSVTLVTVDDGDHFESMIRQGIPRAIPWLQEKAGIATAAAAPVPVPEPSPSPSAFPAPPAPPNSPIAHPPFPRRPRMGPRGPRFRP